MSIVLNGGIIVTGNARKEILKTTALVIDGGLIREVISSEKARSLVADEVIDVNGLVIIPGFVQTHLHLCQTMFRGLADDLQLLDWLQTKIFPFESAHNERSMYVSAMIGIAELLRSGTTTILDMGSIHHEEQIIRAIGETGLRAFVGKAMMDMNDAFPPLRESTKDSVTSTRKLAEQWHNSFNGRIRYAAAPRFVLSCSDTLLSEISEMVKSFGGMLLHTHASENTNEIEAVRKRCGMENIEFLHHLGLLSGKSNLAHCVHLNEREIGILASTDSKVTHCPSSNLKLGSGIANIPYLMDKKINVSLGADGAPCNNTLNMFQEMRVASLLQKPFHGSTSMAAQKVFDMATMGGARALGLENEIGSLEAGKKADLVLLDLRGSWNPLSDENTYSTIVYSGSPENVDSVMIDGQWVYRKKEFVRMEINTVMEAARRDLKQLLERVEYL